ncbi:MAG: hemerythrin domain-containing protein [Pseudomonadota bacterium]|mgnify:CR=1 FL=1
MISQGDDRNKTVGPGGGDPHDPRAAIDAPSSDCTTSPLDFLFDEHLRQRQFAKVLSLIADGVINRKTIASAILFIETDLALHIGDEERSLFPALRSVCEEEDKIEELLEILAKEHREDEAGSEVITAILKKMAAGGAQSEEDSTQLRDFSDRLRHHLALENGVLLPIARMRMNTTALRTVGESMTARRKGGKH